MSLKEPRLRYRLFCVTADFPFGARGERSSWGGGRIQLYLTSLGDGILEAGVQGESVRAGVSRQGVLTHEPCRDMRVTQGSHARHRRFMMRTLASIRDLSQGALSAVYGPQWPPI